MGIGLIIKKLRLSKGMTQVDLAEKLGLSVQTISRWENEVNYPDISLLPQLTALFGVTADYLLGIEADSKKVRLIRTIEVFELDSIEDAHHLLEQFTKAPFPRMVTHKIEESQNTVILTVEKEFGVELNRMRFEE